MFHKYCSCFFFFEGNELEPECKNEIVEHRKMLFSDYQLNPDLMSACENEINTYCKRGIERGGKTLRCLFHNAKLSKTRKNQSITFKAECINEVTIVALNLF